MFIKASVTAVDLNSGVCKCRRDGDGQTLINVTWMTPVGGVGAPTEGDAVWLYKDGGHFVIVGGRSRPGVRPGYIPSLTNSSSSSPSGNISSVGGSTFGGGASPDEMTGDQVLRSSGGAVVGALRGGSVIAKASALAWIFVSKFDHIVRIFSRNYEKHNEAKGEVNVNANGRVFSVEHNYLTQVDAREDLPNHITITGDTDAGEELGMDFRGDVSSFGPGATIRREIVRGVEGNNQIKVFQSDLNLDGSLTETTQVGADICETKQTSSAYTITLLSGGVLQNITMDSGKIRLDSASGTSSIELNPDGTITVVGAKALIDVPETTITGNVTIEGNTTVGGNSSVVGSMGVGMGLSVVGAATMSATITLGGGADIIGDGGVSLLTHKHQTTAAAGPGSHTHDSDVPHAY